MYAASCIARGCALRDKRNTWRQAITFFQQALAVLRAAGLSGSLIFAEASEQLLYVQLHGQELAENGVPMEGFVGVLERRRQRFRQAGTKKPTMPSVPDELIDDAEKAIAEHKEWLEELKQSFYRFASHLVLSAEDGV